MQYNHNLQMKLSRIFLKNSGQQIQIGDRTHAALFFDALLNFLKNSYFLNLNNHLLYEEIFLHYPEIIEFI